MVFLTVRRFHRVLDVDVRGVIAHVLPEFPRALHAPRLFAAAIGIKNRVSGIEHPLEPRHFLQQFLGMLPAHTAVVHAVFVHGLQTRIEKTFCHLADALEHFRRRHRAIVGGLKGHDPHKLRAQPLHARNGAFHFGKRHVKRRFDRLLPITDRGAEGVHAHAGRLELLRHNLESFVRDLVHRPFFEAFHLHRAHLNPFPTELLRHGDLAVNRNGPFIGYAH